MTARQKIQSARTSLVLDQPFFGVLALRLAIVEDPSCRTAWTDGQSMGYNPAFVDKLTHDELLGLVAHEVLHCANGHPWRRDSREPRQWNVAADYAINYVIEESGFKLPTGALRAAQFDGKSAEWIYARIPPQPPDDGAGPGTGGYDVRDAPSEGDGNTEQDWQQAVSQAAQAAKQRGTLPASLARLAKAATEPKVDWRSVLHRFAQETAHDDYSWRTPNTRYIASGLYLPAMHSETTGPMAVALDTSGSIDAVILNQFGAELQSVVDDVKPTRVYVLYCDAKVHRVDVFERGDTVVLHPVGGGGTAFGPVMDAVDAMEEPPVCLIYLTDLDGSHRVEPPSMPVLWATIQERDVPYGEVVRVE